MWFRFPDEKARQSRASLDEAAVVHSLRLLYAEGVEVLRARTPRRARGFRASLP